MAHFYSAATGGFYDSAYHERMPADAKEISHELYAELMSRPTNKGIAATADGLPMLADPPGPTVDQLAAVARAQRDAMLRTVYDPAVAMLQRAARLNPSNAEQYVAKLAEFDAWAVALQAVPEQTGFPQSIDWPQQPTAEGL